jgi:serine/threonine-protein kinase
MGGAGALVDANIKPPSGAVDNALPEAKARRRALRGDLDRIALTAMAPDPRRRYPSVEALSADLHNWLAGRAINARGQRQWYRVGKLVARHRVGFAATLLAIAALLGTTAYSVHEAQLARTQAARANAVRDFVVGVFEQTDPDERHGKPITARELLDRGDRELAQGKVRANASRAEMQGLIGHLYWLIGDYPKAVSLMKGAIAHSDSAMPADVRARNLLYLAQSEAEKELFEAARGHARQAEALAVQAGPAGASVASDARRLYASALTLDGDAKAAEPVLRKALDEDGARFGTRSPAVADDLTELARATHELSQYSDSIAFSREAIARETALHGRASSPVIGNLEILASTEDHAGDLESAERDLLETVRLATQLYGPAHNETIGARTDLYFTYYRQARYAEALAGHLDLLKPVVAMARERPEQLAYEWNFIAIDYEGLARYDEALQAEQRSLATWARIHSSDSEYASNDSRTNLGDILARMGRFKEAESTYQEAIRIERKNGPPDSEWLNRDLGDLGVIYRMEHRYQDAIAITSAGLRAISPNAMMVRAFLQSSLALAQLEWGDDAAAEKSAAQAMQTGRKAYKNAPLSFSALQYASARVALARHQAATAESLLRMALYARKVLAPNDPRTIEVQVALICALEMQGNRKEAKILRAKIEPLLAASRSPYFADLRKSIGAH